MLAMRFDRSVLFFLSVFLFIVVKSEIAKSEMIAYVISTENKIQAPTTLTRIVDGKIAWKHQIGRSVSYSYSKETLAVFSSIGKKNVIQTWDLASGKRKSRCTAEYAGKDSVVVMTAFKGALQTIKLDSSGNHILFAGFKKITKTRLRNGIQRPYPVMVFSAATFNIHTGKYTEFKIPRLRIGAMWNSIKDKDVIVQKDGTYLSLHPTKLSLDLFPILFNSDVIYVPSLGMVKHTEDKGKPYLVLVADQNLKPLLTPRIIGDTPECDQARVRSSQDNEPLFVYTRSVSESSIQVRIRNLKSKKEIFKKVFLFKKDVRLYVSSNAKSFLLVSRKEKRAAYFDRTTGVTTKIDYSWASLSSVIPYFPSK